MKCDAKYVFFLVLLIFSMLNFVSAAPPVTTVQQFPEGYTIEVHPIKEYFKIGENVTFHIHLFNGSSGYPINVSTICRLHLYNSNGSHQATLSTSSVDDLHDYEIFVNGGNFTSELKSYHAYCYDGVGGDYPYTIEVTQSGENPNIITLISYIFLFLCVVSLMSFMKAKHSRVDFEKSRNNIIENSTKNGDIMVKGILTGLFKNSFIWLYFTGWILVLIMREIIYLYGSVTVYSYFVIMANIYSLGLFLVTVYMIGYLIGYMREIFGILTDNNWGVGK